MILLTPPNDPVICRSSDLLNHERVLDMFSAPTVPPDAPGPHAPHLWFSRPSARKGKVAQVVAEGWGRIEGLLARKGKKGGGGGGGGAGAGAGNGGRETVVG